MRYLLRAFAVLVFFAIALLPGIASAGGPTEGRSATIIEGVTATGSVSGGGITLTARLRDADGNPMGGETMVFYELSTVFGERLMEVGRAVTDSSGSAALAHQPTWRGEHTVVVRYGGSDARSPSQATFRFESTAPAHEHENAEFGLEGPRRWAPIGIGLAVLAVWGILGLALARAVLGISGYGAVAGSIPLPTMPDPLQRLRQPLRPASLTPVLVLLGGLTILALPIGWALPRGGANEPPAWTRVPADRITNRTPIDTPFPATLVETIPSIRMDDTGRPSRDSADLPSDVVVVDDRVLVLDTNKGRVLTLAPEGKFARTFESDRRGKTSLLRAEAMTQFGKQLYVAAPLFGNVVVLSTSGNVERVIEAQVPEGDRPFHPAGIAVGSQGRVWVSDSSNHRVVEVSDTGMFLTSIGEGLASSDREGLDTPEGLALDFSGNLLVADSGNRVVKKYSPIGVFLDVVGKEQLSNPRAIAVDYWGNIFVSDTDLHAVLAFAPDGSFLGAIGGSGNSGTSAGAQLQYPDGLAVDGDRLYVVDRLAGVFVFELGAE